MLAALLLAPGIAAAAPLYCVAFGVNSIDCTPASAAPLSSLDVPTGLGVPASAFAGTTTAPASLGAQAVASGSSGFAFIRHRTSGALGIRSRHLRSDGRNNHDLAQPERERQLRSSSARRHTSNVGTLTVTTTLDGSQGTATAARAFSSRDLATSGDRPRHVTVAPGHPDGTCSPFRGTSRRRRCLSAAARRSSLSLSLDAQARCQDSFGGPCGTSTNYLSTLGLRTTGPVFNLPAGWTANAPDGSIVNNLFVAVPESSTWALVALSVLGIVAARRLAIVEVRESSPRPCTSSPTLARPKRPT